MSVANEVELLNIALGYLGAGSITTTDENSKQARELSKHKGQALDEVLRKIAPAFAVKRAALVAYSTGTNMSDYDYRYTVPSDSLKILSLLDADDYTPLNVTFDIEDGILYCDESTLAVQYVYRQTDFTKFDSTFVEAYALYMAARVAPSLLPGGIKYQRQYLGLYYQKVIEAAGVANEVTSKSEQKPAEYNNWW